MVNGQLADKVERDIDSELAKATNVMHRLAEAYPTMHAEVRRAITNRILEDDLYDTVFYLNPKSDNFYAVVNPLFLKEKNNERSPMHIFDNPSSGLYEIIAESYGQLKKSIGEPRIQGRGFSSEEEYEKKVRDVAYVVYKNTTHEVTAQDAIVVATYMIRFDLARELDKKTTATDQKGYLQQAIMTYKAERKQDQPECLILHRLEDSLNKTPQLKIPFPERRAA